MQCDVCHIAILFNGSNGVLLSVLVRNIYRRSLFASGTKKAAAPEEAAAL
jgi:hypothetical protein